jgi:class 3 adenylate cyclase
MILRALHRSSEPSSFHEDATRSKRALLIAALLVLGIGLFYELSPLTDEIQTRFAAPLEFRTRHVLGRDPKIDPRIKVYAIGDTTLAYLQQEDLPLGEWLNVVHALAKQKPRAIFIDKIFGTPPGLERAPEFVSQLKRLPFPVVAGSFVSPMQISQRPLFSLEDPEYILRKALHHNDDLESLTKLPIRQGYAYGPHPKVRNAFQVGHILYGGDNRALAYYRIDQMYALPAAPLLVAKRREFRHGELYVDGHHVSLDGRGRTLINFAPPGALAARTTSLASLLDTIRNGKGIELPENAVVVILPAMFTGNKDMIDSPFGTVPGGYAMISLVNSVLTGEWLTQWNGWSMILGLGAVGIALGFFLYGIPFWIALFVGTAFNLAFGLGLFAYANCEVPWIFSTLSLVLPALALFVSHSLHNEVRLFRIRESLSGAISPERLDTFLRSPASLQLEPTGKVVTIMFIDIVGFSVSAEQQSPRDAFLNLRTLMETITRTVHQFGGVVDKTMGDGMLCFFGYNYEGKESSPDHPDQALRCAVQIQRESLQRSLEAQNKNAPVYPLRIGINTAAVYIGDLGAYQKIDMTVIGHGVNYAKRLESACESFCILLGATTRDMLLHRESIGIPLQKRFIQVKHVSELQEAYECDPFFADPSSRAKALSAYRGFIKIDRKETRWPVPPQITLLVGTPFGTGRLVNFSESGLALSLDHYMGRDVQISLTLDSPDGALRRRLTELGLLPLISEVRWGRPTEEGKYLTGVMVKNLSKTQREKLLDELRKSLAFALPKTG